MMWLILIFLSLALLAALFVIAPALFSRGEGQTVRKYWAAGIAGAVVLLSGLGFYSYVGRPDYALMSLRGQPDPNNFYELVVYLARVIRDRPNDIQGWTILGGAYLAFGEVDQAAAAYERAVNLAQSQGANVPPDLIANFAVARVLQNGGAVSPDMEDIFRHVLSIDPENVQARYHIGVAHAQRGENEAALALWEPLMAEAPSAGYWRANLPFQISALRDGAQGAEGAAAQAPNVRAMVDGLAARLNEEPDDLDGWLMLIRAYAVLQEMENARGALAIAREFFAGDETAQNALTEQARASSLE